VLVLVQPVLAQISCPAGQVTGWRTGTAVVLTGSMLTRLTIVSVGVTFGWKQYLSTGAPVTARECAHGSSAHWVKAASPHFATAAVRSRHSQGAWHVTVGAAVTVVVTATRCSTGAAGVGTTVIPRVTTAASTVKARQRTRIRITGIRPGQDLFTGLTLIIQSL
jgi:hypothetical protein